MAEISYWWTTDGTGDGPSGGYTQVHLSDVIRATAGASYYEGVVPSLLNECAGTVGGANTFAINTGSGVVDGKLYENDASVNVNIPSTSSDTRIDRIVLRADWTAQTIRITRIAGTQSSTPSAPAVTQTAGSTYDIKLYQVRVNTSGTVTTEADEREWAVVPVDESTIENNDGTLQVKDDGITTAKIATGAVDTTELAADAVTTAKIAAGAVDTAALGVDAVTRTRIADDAVGVFELDTNSVTADAIAAGAVDTSELAADSVDDTKAGDRVPQFYRRQGASATNWHSPGTTTYTPGAVRMQGGAKTWSGASADSGTFTITYPTAFSYAPLLFVTPSSITSRITVASVSGASATVATVYWDDTADATQTSIDFVWLAVGPE